MAEETKVNVLKIETKDSVDNLKKLKQEIKDLKGKLLGLDEGTQEYSDALSELSAKTFALRDITEKANRANADFGEVLANVSGLAGSATSAMAGFQAVLQLIGDESDEMQKLTQNVISLMAIAQSFSAIEDSIDRFKNLKIAIGGVTKGLGKFKVALGATGIGAVAIGVGVLVGQLVKLKQKTDEVKNEYKEYNEAISGNIANLEKLRYNFNAYGDDINSKRQYLLDHAEDFKNLGINVNDVNDAEKKLNDNFDTLIAKITRSQDLQELNEKLEASVKRMRDAQSEWDRLDQKDKNGELRTGSKVKQEQIIREEQDLQKQLLADINVIETEITNEKKEQKKIEEDLKKEEEEKERRAEEYRKRLAEQTAELKRQEELRKQGLVWAETEEDLEDELPSIETENDNFKFTNYTDDDYVDSAIASAKAVRDAEVQIAMETSERLRQIEEERRQRIIENVRGTVDGMMMIASTTSQLLSSIQANIDTSTKKGFEENKKFERAQATIAYLQGLVSAWSSAMTLPPFLIPAVGLSLTGLLTGVWATNLSKINSTKFGSSTSASASPSSSAIGALQMPQMTNARPTFMEGDIENLPSQRVYVLASDIEQATNTRRVTVRNSTF